MAWQEEKVLVGTKVVGRQACWDLLGIIFLLVQFVCY